MRYRILAHVGRGGMGEVYRAEHLGLRRAVALKVLRAEYSTPELQARFEREARATARLDHPGCVRVHDYGRTVDRCQFLAMDFVEGPTLAAVLARDGRVSTGRAARLGRDLLGALAHAHARGVLHRDVKPENVMLAWADGRPRAVLIDFGLARLRDDGPLTAAGMCLGSPSYVAPERLLGRAYDARADVYAVGVILYELLAGERPFGAGARSAEEIARAHLGPPPRPLRAVRDDVSPALEAVILRALAREPARRFAHAGAMLSALIEAPVSEREAAEAAAEARAEEASTVALAQISVYRPPVLSRLWSWLRWGAWRWPGPGQIPAGR